MTDDLVKRLRIEQDHFDLEQYEFELLGKAADLIEAQKAEIERLRAALELLRDCDWVISLPDRMDAVREIARKALGDAS